VVISPEESQEQDASRAEERNMLGATALLVALLLFICILHCCSNDFSKERDFVTESAGRTVGAATESASAWFEYIAITTTDRDRSKLRRRRLILFLAVVTVSVVAIKTASRRELLTRSEFASTANQGSDASSPCDCRRGSSPCAAAHLLLLLLLQQVGEDSAIVILSTALKDSKSNGQDVLRCTGTGMYVV
jgi:hypothetical protein